MKLYPPALLAALALGACSPANKPPNNLPPPPTVASVDVQRYLGTWHQQALVPNKFQAMCVSNTSATYAREGDGLSVLNQCRNTKGEMETAKGVAKIVEGSNNAKLKVSFFRPFYGDYWVLALDPDYQWVLVGDPTRAYGWVLSRATRLAPAQMDQVLDRAVALGYERKQFEVSPFTTP